MEWESRITDNKVQKANDTIKELKDSINDMRLSILRHATDSNGSNKNKERPINQ
jgi:hypothetical protein